LRVLLEIILETLREFIDYDIKSDQESNQKSDQKIINLIKKDSKITIKKICEETMLSQSGVKKIIKKLKEENRIIRVGSLKGGYWKIIN